MELACERYFVQPDGAKLDLECRFGKPESFKLTSERHFVQSDGMALERLFWQPDGAKVVQDRRFWPKTKPPS